MNLLQRYCGAFCRRARLSRILIYVSKLRFSGRLALVKRLPRYALRQVLVFLFSAFGAISWGHAEVVITNPGLADHETLSYTETIDTLTRPFEVTLTLNPTAPAHYEFHSVGADLESTYRLDPTTLQSLSSESVTSGVDATVLRTVEYRNLKTKPGKDDLVVTDLGSLPIVLRGFPWGTTSFAKLLYVGNTSYAGSAISFELQVVGRQSIAAAGRTWDCWHVTTGLGGALGLLMAKTEWWFAAEGSHPLIKASGPSGGPGSPTRMLLLQSYTIGR